MRKTILVVLMVLVFATPCLAKEVEPNGLFSVDNTIWGVVDENFSLARLGFADGLIYQCYEPFTLCNDEPLLGGVYFNLFMLTLFVADDSPPWDKETFWGILIPSLGIGWGRVCPEGDPCILLTMEKLSDTFNPDM